MGLSDLGGGSLWDLPRLRDCRRRRVSSHDKTGGNRDYVVVPKAATYRLAEIKGAGCIRHIWVTIRCSDRWYLRKILFRMYWDGEEDPSVGSPWATSSASATGRPTTSSPPRSRCRLRAGGVSTAGGPCPSATAPASRSRTSATPMSGPSTSTSTTRSTTSQSPGWGGSTRRGTGRTRRAASRRRGWTIGSGSPGARTWTGLGTTSSSRPRARATTWVATSTSTTSGRPGSSTGTARETT